MSYYATAGAGGAANGTKQVAIQAAKSATTKALVDHGFAKATGGKYGREFTWENYLTSFATSVATTGVSKLTGSKLQASEGAGAFEIAGKKLGSSAVNGFVSDTIRRNTYGSYDADKETGLNFLERTLQSTSTSLANDLGNSVAKSTLQSYYGDDDVGQARFDYIKEQEKLNAQQPDWVDSTLDFLGIADLPTQAQQPKNVLAAEQQANENLREKTDLIDLGNAQAAIGDDPGSMSDVAVLGRQGLFADSESSDELVSNLTGDDALEYLRANKNNIELGLGSDADKDLYNRFSSKLYGEEPNKINEGLFDGFEETFKGNASKNDDLAQLQSYIQGQKNALELGKKSENKSALSLSATAGLKVGDAKFSVTVNDPTTPDLITTKAKTKAVSVSEDLDVDVGAKDITLRKGVGLDESSPKGIEVPLGGPFALRTDFSESAIPKMTLPIGGDFEFNTFFKKAGGGTIDFSVSGEIAPSVDLNQAIRNNWQPYRPVDNLAKFFKDNPAPSFLRNNLRDNKDE